ncbi:MAG: helix-turn-helix transcriptional regulator [Clostridia bacterium]|jgi:transcriptional regulator with XRE-family HTH domain
MKEVENYLGDKIKNLRKEFKYTQQDISEFLGIDQSLISKYESAERMMSVDLLEKLGDLFGCDLVSYDKSDVGNSTPIKVSFRASDICSDDMDAISTVNRVALNCAFMNKLLKENR